MNSRFVRSLNSASAERLFQSLTNPCHSCSALANLNFCQPINIEENQYFNFASKSISQRTQIRKFGFCSGNRKNFTNLLSNSARRSDVLTTTVRAVTFSDSTNRMGDNRNKGSGRDGHRGKLLQFTDSNGAERFLGKLSKKERNLLLLALQKHRNGDQISCESSECDEDENGDGHEPIDAEQLRALFLINTLPFVGFGFLDNFIMLLAGEYIDFTLGVWLNLSTMAAAGFGNIISDLAGVGSAHYVETLLARFTNIRTPKLSHEQASSSRARFAMNFGRAVGLTIGCLLGMVPLIFYDPDKKKKLIDQLERNELEELDS